MFLWPDEVEQAEAASPAAPAALPLYRQFAPGSVPPFHVFTSGPARGDPGDDAYHVMDSGHQVVVGPSDWLGLIRGICDLWNHEAKTAKLAGFLLQPVLKP